MTLVERLAAARPERAEPGLEPGDDPGLRPRQRHASRSSLASPMPSQLDTGAQAFATLDAGAVSAATPAATLSTGNASDPSLLASTPDANTTDPFIQEEAAALDYNPQNIFNFLHTQIGYNSYTRLGARRARHALVERRQRARRRQPGRGLDARLGHPGAVRLGDAVAEPGPDADPLDVPGQLSDGRLHPGRHADSDPANDPQLLSETEVHYWFQFDTGSGMTDADPLMPGATIGQTFTTSTGTFTAVPADLEETTEVQLVAEITNTASALFGLGGQQDTTVLDQTFDDVELVGRPLTLGFNVSSSSAGFHLHDHDQHLLALHGLGRRRLRLDARSDHRGSELSGSLDQLPVRRASADGSVSERHRQRSARAVADLSAERCSIGSVTRRGRARQSRASRSPPGPAPAFSNFDAYTLDMSAAADDPHPAAETDSEIQADAAQIVTAAQGSQDLADRVARHLPAGSTST